MVAYSFQRRFIAPIEERTKVQTIRAIGKRRHAQLGDMLQIYFGMRTQHCRKIIRDQPCTISSPVFINFGVPSVCFAGDVLVGREALDRFAVTDGFQNWPELVEFWAENHPGVDVFEGLLIGWT